MCAAASSSARLAHQLLRQPLCQKAEPHMMRAGIELPIEQGDLPAVPREAPEDPEREERLEAVAVAEQDGGVALREREPIQREFLVADRHDCPQEHRRFAMELRS